MIFRDSVTIDSKIEEENSSLPLILNRQFTVPRKNISHTVGILKKKNQSSTKRKKVSINDLFKK